ncbi:LysR substrate-binding domain-containing protein [Modestobacter sp. NPDC049651]|uniref:LysR family transcriptional regulator n=1 Tax=unclassified Modestobacter TaxID=2643866 RepID=UPI00341136D3
MDLDLRKVRYFVAVAEHRHFGRAAESLFIAQPVLSRQSRALERELGVVLFVRDTRGTELSAAGEQLLADAPALLGGAAAVQRRVARAGRGERVLVVGFMPGVVVTPAVRAFGRAHPDVVVDVVRTGWDDQVTTLRDGRVDVGYVRLPLDRTGLHVEQLAGEPRVAALPADHPLAGKERLRLADLVGDHLLQDPDAVPEWRDLGIDGGAWHRLPAVRTVEEKLEHVAAGSGFVALPASTARAYPRPDVAVVEVADLPATVVALAWQAGRGDPLVRAFAEVAVRLAGTALTAR